MPTHVVEFLQTPPARIVIWVAVLAVLTIVGIYVVRRFRDGVEQTETTSDLLAKFREMRQQGHLSDAEFRTIRTSLGERLQSELKQDSEPS